jgi:hypothetical protein
VSRPSLAAALLLAALSLAACSAPPVDDLPDGGAPDAGDGGALADPCAPHGHIHREATGDWCHCDRGHLAAQTGLSCVPDPDYVPRDGGFDFGDDGEHACFHVAYGPYATVTSSAAAPPRVDAFHTHYTATLEPVDGGYGGRFSYRAFATGPHVAYLSEPVPVRFVEGGVGPLEVQGERATQACDGLRHMAGFELTDKVTYTLEVGPTASPRVGLVIEYLP